MKRVLALSLRNWWGTCLLKGQFLLQLLEQNSELCVFLCFESFFFVFVVNLLLYRLLAILKLVDFSVQFFAFLLKFGLFVRIKLLLGLTQFLRLFLLHRVCR